MKIFSKVEHFLLQFCPLSTPLLLALSGGPDSLCLFYSLLKMKELHGTDFHIAHIDHGWRLESASEAKELEELACKYQIPFHLKVLDLSKIKGNLEDACRNERYAFFFSLCQKIPFQGVLTGHHRDDQAETIFKRILEGANLSCWKGLQRESFVKGVRVLRPLLEISKKEIRKDLEEKGVNAFEDPTNEQEKFLRARLRKKILPSLAAEFGKEFEHHLIRVGKEAEELTDYFRSRLLPLYSSSVQGIYGIYLDLKNFEDLALIEIKYLLRFLSEKQEFFLSRTMIEEAAGSLQLGEANKLYAMGNQKIWIDRKRIFILNPDLKTDFDLPFKVTLGNQGWKDWRVAVTQEVYSSDQTITSWKDAWRGRLCVYLPPGNYIFTSIRNKGENRSKIKKKWSESKVPAFLYDYFPVICEKEKIVHEFLTGKSLLSLKDCTSCWRIELFHEAIMARSRI